MQLLLWWLFRLKLQVKSVCCLVSMFVVWNLEVLPPKRGWELRCLVLSVFSFSFSVFLSLFFSFSFLLSLSSVSLNVSVSLIYPFCLLFLHTAAFAVLWFWLPLCLSLSIFFFSLSLSCSLFLSLLSLCYGLSLLFVFLLIWFRLSFFNEVKCFRMNSGIDFAVVLLMGFIAACPVGKVALFFEESSFLGGCTTVTKR